MLNNSTKLKENKEKKENKENKESKKKIKQSKQLKVVSIDLIEEQKQEQEQEIKEKEKAELLINNIDLRYFANQNINPSFKTNKLEQLLSNNYLLKDIYANIEENITTYKEHIIKYNTTTLEKIIENNDDAKIASGEKYKLYYLLYVLNLIAYLKEKKIKNSIKEELKDFNNNNNYCDDASLNDFNIYNTTLDSMCAKKHITNLDLFVVRKSSNTKRKILPQKRS
jgi:hypothetical protein